MAPSAPPYIAAGNYVHGVSYIEYGPGTAKGVGPHARLAVYKVSGADENLNAVVDITAAIDAAISDGVDVISASWSYKPMPLHLDPFAKASFTTMEKGIVVSTAAGNNGPGIGTVRNANPWALTVTADTTDRWFAGILTLGSGLTITGWDNSEDDSNLPLVYNKTISQCRTIAMLTGTPHGIVICDKGDVHVQITCILFSGLAGAVLVFDKLDLHELKTMACPCIAITSKDAAAPINNVETTHKPLASMKFQETFMDNKPAPVVAPYASRGPSPIVPYVLKPDVMAAGSLVLGAWIASKSAARRGLMQPLYNNYVLDFGTSMACPHVAGVAAHPKWSAAAIRSAIMTTATPLDYTMHPILDTIRLTNASPLAMGSRQINPNGLIYDASPQDYVNLLCSMNFTWGQIFAITGSIHYKGSSSADKSYPDLNYPSFIALYDDDQSKGKGLMVRKFQRTLTNVAAVGGQNHKGSFAISKVNITPPEDSIVIVWPETLIFEKEYDARSFTVTIKYQRKEKGAVSFGDLV